MAARNNMPNLNLKFINDFSTTECDTTKRTHVSTENQATQVKPVMCSISTQNSNKQIEESKPIVKNMSVQTDAPKPMLFDDCESEVNNNNSFLE